MNTLLKVTGVRFVPAPARQLRAGLLGWATFVMAGQVRVDGVAIRRTLDGRRALSFPERTDSSGRRHPVIRPLDDYTRREIETQVFAALGFAEAVR